MITGNAEDKEKGETHEELQKILEKIAKIRNSGFKPKNINIVMAPAKIVITPLDRNNMVWGDRHRELEIIVNRKEGTIRIVGVKLNDPTAKEFAESIFSAIKNDEYLNLKYSVEIF